MNMNEDPRFALAAERTLLAWIRTGVAMMGFGFIVARFGLFLHEIQFSGMQTGMKKSPGYSMWIGIALVVLGVMVCLAAAWDHFQISKSIDEDKPLPRNFSLLGITTALLLAAIGAGTAIYLILLH